MKKNMLSSRIAGVLMLGVGPALVGTFVPAEVLGSLGQEEGGVHFDLKACTSLLEQDTAAKEALDRNLQELVENGFNAEKLLAAAERDVLFDEQLQTVGVFSDSAFATINDNSISMEVRPVAYKSFGELLSWIEKTGSWVYSARKQNLVERAALLIALGQYGSVVALLKKSPSVKTSLTRDRIAGGTLAAYLRSKRDDLVFAESSVDLDNKDVDDGFFEEDDDDGDDFNAPPTNESSKLSPTVPVSLETLQGPGAGGGLSSNKEVEIPSVKPQLEEFVNDLRPISQESRQPSMFVIECPEQISIPCGPETEALQENREVLDSFGVDFGSLMRSAGEYFSARVSEMQKGEKTFDFAAAVDLIGEKGEGSASEESRIASLLVLGQLERAFSAIKRSPSAAKALLGGDAVVSIKKHWGSVLPSNLQPGARQPFGDRPFIFDVSRDQNFQGGFGQFNQERDFSAEKRRTSLPPESQNQSRDLEGNENGSGKEEEKIESEKSLNSDNSDTLSGSHSKSTEDDQKEEKKNKIESEEKSGDGSNNDNSNLSTNSKSKEESKLEEESKKSSRRESEADSSRQHNSNSNPSNRNDNLSEVSEHFSQKGRRKEGGSKLIKGKVLMRGVQDTLGVSGTYDKETVRNHTEAMNRLADQMAQHDQVLQGVTTNLEALLNLLKKKVDE